METKSRFFSIARNAQTNTYRNAEARQVSSELDFTGEDIRLTVSDNGIGLSSGYAEQGHGFAGMSEDAERLGGHLAVEERG